MTDIAVNPAVLVWARKERGLTTVEAAKRLKVSEAQLRELEQSTALPIAQLRQMASQYAVTFASLLMPEPLPASTRIQVKDFRTAGGRGPLADHDMLVQLDDLNGQLDMLADLREAAPELFVGETLPRASLASEPEKIAEQERARIGVTLDEQIAWQKDTFSFRRWRARLEAQGVFVYSLDLGETRVCRGLSILDDRKVPAAVVNSKEASYRARNFTLWHEYAHILLRETGISDENRKNVVERFCNQFSAFFLMPRKDFLRVAKLVEPKTGIWGEYQVARLSTLFRVTKTVASIHMEETGVVPPGHYKELRSGWAMYRPKKSGGIATPAEKKLNKYGVRHVGIVLRAFESGRINQVDAHELLDAKTKDFGSLRKEATVRQEEYGGVGY